MTPPSPRCHALHAVDPISARPMWYSAMRAAHSLVCSTDVCHERAGSAPLPAPLFIAHSPSGEFAAFGYPDAVEVYALTTTFQLLTRIAVHNPVDAIWLDTALITSTPTAISAHFITPPAPKGQQLASQTALFAQSGSDGLAELSRIPTAANFEVQSITLATNRVAHGRPLSHAVSQPELPAVVLRPGMLWKLVRITRETLWMVSTSGHAWAMSLRHPGVTPSPCRTQRPGQLSPFFHLMQRWGSCWRCMVGGAAGKARLCVACRAQVPGVGGAGRAARGAAAGGVSAAPPLPRLPRALLLRPRLARRSRGSPPPGCAEPPCPLPRPPSYMTALAHRCGRAGGVPAVLAAPAAGGLTPGGSEEADHR